MKNIHVESEVLETVDKAVNVVKVATACIKVQTFRRNRLLPYSGYKT